ncbi:MAG TPA: TonB-dependent receptor [Pyrinomonadaceae bacterium]|nr:TonB-dependent receptor [Pyrinomonadaceae bacterium]
MKKISIFIHIFVLTIAIFDFNTFAQSNSNSRTFSGVVVTSQFELVPNVNLEVQTSNGKLQTVTDAEGNFSLQVPVENINVRFYGKSINSVTRTFSSNETLTGLQIKITYLVSAVNESVTIQAESVTPEVEQRNDTVYKNNLFGRDDQVIQTLNAGINAGQHEGGGKSLEIRRFGFNLDHGGVNGGVKILVDNFQQNQGTQGHGQGYLGNLKSLTPELVQDVSIINGPFSAAYGDFSGLGVVQIHLKESLPNQLTARIQGGSFNTFRTFLAYSPQIKNVASFIAYEGSFSDGPFKNPLKYRRDNFTGNFAYKLNENEAFGFKFNGGRNNFFSSGQIPLDEVFAGRLDRFGFLDPENGGRVKLGSFSTYYRKEWASGKTLRADAFLGRSLFDLFSNFTFFTLDPIYGDEIQQHDSRLQEGGNLQFLQPYKVGNNQALLTVGGNLHFNQINVGLYPSVGRNPNRKLLPGNMANPEVLYTSSQVNISNYAGYIQNGMDLADGHLHLEGGLRWDYFKFDVNGFEQSDVKNNLIGKEGAYKFQPKASLVYSPFEKFPISFYGNYGRGISSQDARGVIRNPDSPKISTTDFYQTGAAFNSAKFSIAPNFFFIDRSNEQVYIPDDGSIEFAGRSRSYGFELKTSTRINKYLSFNGGLTQVIGAFYPGEFSTLGKRIIVDSAPHTVANGSLILTELDGFNSSLNWRHISNYRLDAEDETIRASGNDVIDFNLTKRLKKWVDLNFSIDNLLNKKYWETQNYFESRICPVCTIESRIHATPGYSRAFNIGVTFRFWAKN